MELYFGDYEEGTFDDNRKITATLANIAEGDGSKWAEPILRKLSQQEPHILAESWRGFKEAFLINFADPIKKEKAIRSLNKLVQTGSTQAYTTQF